MKPLDWVSPAPANWPDQQVVTEATEIEGSQSHTPGSVQPVAMFETLQKTTLGIVNVHKAQARTVRFQRRTGLVEHTCDDNVVADGVHAKGHEQGREVVIDETIFRERAIAVERACVRPIWRQIYTVKSVVINIDTALAEIRQVEVGLAIDEGLVRPVKADPSVALPTMIACVEGGATPGPRPTSGFHPQSCHQP